MSDQTIKLIELLNQGKTCNEISSILNISNKQLFSNLTNLRNKGFFYKRKYFSNGNIVYNGIKSNDEIKNFLVSNKETIITSHDETTLKSLVISDLHFGNSCSRLNLVERVFDYAVKNDIHIIMCCGDLIDGSFSKFEQDIKSIYEQIDYFIHNYPFDKNILTFCVGGNHDFSGVTEKSQSINEAVKNYRHDIIISDYNNAVINIKNDNILLFHYVKGGFQSKENVAFTLSGHSHDYVSKYDNNRLLIRVPSLSDLSELPTCLEMELFFQNGYIQTANFKHLYLGSKALVLSEMIYNLLENRNVDFGPISNEETLIDESLAKDKQLVLSQIDKFNKRYNLSK